MKSTIYIGLVLLGIFLAVSCEEYLGSNVDCKDCLPYKPDSANLIIQVTINQENPEVPIVLFRGNVEENKVDYVDTIRENPHYIYSAVNQVYSVAAYYNADGKILIAIDGGSMKVKHVADACPSECWIITEGVLNAELKFD